VVVRRGVQPVQRILRSVGRREELRIERSVSRQLWLARSAAARVHLSGRMIQPVDLKEPRRIPLPLGGTSATTDVWAMLLASRDGDLARVTSLLSRDAGLLRCEYGYATPLHFAVREGHVNLTRYLLEHGALDPTYYSDPFRD